MKDRNFAIVAGDRRSYELAKLLLEKGHKVNLYGFNKLKVDKQIKEVDSIMDAVNDADIVIMPIPITRDSININAPYYEGDIPIEEVFKSMKKDQLLIGGKTSDCIEMKEYYSIDVIDIMDREEMAVLNAIPTAEGSIQIALEKMSITLHGSDVMVLGFGRIGKIIAKILHGMGSNVYVLAKKHSDVSWVKTYGYNPVYIYELKENLADMDLIINTIPKEILNEKLLETIDKETLIIDLASMPGGVDYIAADKIGMKVIHALGLPGKVAPVSSAGFMLDTIYNIVEELGV